MFFLDDLKKQNNKVFSVLEDIFRNILVENRNFQIFTYSSKAAGLLLKSVVELMFQSLLQLAKNMNHVFFGNNILKEIS